MAFRLRCIALAGAMAVLPVAAHAEVFKCVDGAGRITYQETPCDAGARGGRVTLPEESVAVREPPEVEAAWRDAAARHEVTKGMPKRWVQQALGVPVAIRRGTPNDGATEIWSYDLPAGMTRVGFAGSVVAWQRTEPRNGTASPAAESADAARGRVAVDRPCDEVLAELGPAASKENIQLATGADAVRYTYDPVAGGLPVRLTFTCANGRVAAVSRGVPR